MSKLQDRDWMVSYSHEDGDLVELFYGPVLSCAQLYRRATGYFSGSVMALAARGLDSLIERGGRMELLVGCTLSSQDIEEIGKGYDVREHIGRTRVNELAFESEDSWARERIGYLAWMIAHGFLDVKLAIPLDEHGQMKAGLGLYHAKMGIISDDAGDRLVFKGSINETHQGWKTNCESFDVSCSWRGDWDPRRVNRSSEEFAKLWSGQAKSARVLEFPDALREKLLEFLPADDKFVAPPKRDEGVEEVVGPATEAELEERRRQVWSFIATAPKRPDDGQSFTVATSAVKPWPHQLRAFKRMMDSWPFRLLVADEVGLGKTIEAGLVIRHAKISGLAKRILILTPASVMRQWQGELHEKFNLFAPIYTGSTLLWPEHHFRREPLEHKVSRQDWVKQPLLIASSHLMRRQERMGDLIEGEAWDLLVLDEAHHARRRGAGTPQERGSNRLLTLMQRMKDKAASLLLMTATPMQVDPVEIWDLLALLGLPPAWTSDAFRRYFETLGKNPDEKQLFDLTKLFQATEEAYGPIDDATVDGVGEGIGLSKMARRKVVDAIRERESQIPLKRLNTDQRRAAVAIMKANTPVQRRMSRHTRNLLRHYYKAGLLDSPIAERKVEDVPIPLSSSERQVYEAVENYISTTYQGAAPGKKTAVGFVMTIYRRRLASSFFALRRTLQDRYARLSDQPSEADGLRLDEDVDQNEQSDETMAPDEAATLEVEALQVEERGSISDLLRSIAKLGTDSKACKLFEILNDVLTQGHDSAIVFTQYTDTMDFLKQYLGDQLNLTIGCFSGRGGERRDNAGHWMTCSKEQIKRMVREGDVRILICTDAAGEGLNLQSSGVLINYDLPWNPMKVEQRIGRIDRIGQKHREIRIFNLAYENTVEADVYFALSKRIGLFLGVVGKLQPILSQLPKQFEHAVLQSVAERERSRHEAVAAVETLVRSAEQAPFDIDEVSDRDVSVPRLPASPVSLAQLNQVMRDASLLPNGTECRELEQSTFALRLPGEAEFARVTTSSDVFEDHFESHQIVAPDSPLFWRLARGAGAVSEDPVDPSEGNFDKVLA